MTLTNYGWAGKVDDYLKTDQKTLIDSLFNYHQRSLNEKPSTSQTVAWKNCYRILTQFFGKLSGIDPKINNQGLIFEYELPRERGRRPDVLLLSNQQLIVMEFKDHFNASQAFIDQVSAYARDLKNYHGASHGLEVVPLLILTRANDLPRQKKGILIADSTSLEQILFDIINLAESNGPDLKSWLKADYDPLPSLVSAARQIFQHEPLPYMYIKRAHSAGIPQTIKTVISIAKEAQQKKEHHLVLITGVPGAGKTLVGLQLVYNNHFKDTGSDRSAVFLSGNGPLVQVLQHALKSTIFVQDVHGFLKQYGGRSQKIPHEPIWVYDEAQRAWDSQRVNEKRGHKKSEPEDFLWIGEKKPNWAVMVGLIGEGQEIHLGEEAGLIQWNEAVAKMPNQWIVNCPDRIQRTFSNAAKVRSHQELDLNISLRTHLAEDVQSWVKKPSHGRYRKSGSD